MKKVSPIELPVDLCHINVGNVNLRCLAKPVLSVGFCGSKGTVENFSP